MKINFRLLVSILAIPAFIYAIIYLHLHSRYLIYGDEAEYMNNAWRAFTGDRPYKDFWLLFPPGEVYWPALIFYLFGVNLNIILLSNMLVTMLVATWLFLIFKQLKCSTPYAIIASFLFIMQGYFLFFTWLCLVSCHLLLKYAVANRRIFLLASGLIAGVALLFRIYQVAPFCIAGVVFLLMGRKAAKQKINDCLLFAGMAAVPVVITILLLWNIKGTMYYALVIDAVSHGTSMNVPYWHKMAEDWDKFLLYIDYSHINPKQFPLKGLFIMSANFLFDVFERMAPFVLIILVVYDIFSKSFRSHFAAAKVMFIIWGLLYLPYALNLSGHEHIIQAYLPFLVLIYLYGFEIFSFGKNVVVKSVLILCMILIVVNAASKLYEVYRPGYSPYNLKTETASFYINNEETFKTMRGIVNFIFNNTSEGDYIFSLTWNTPPLYALTKRKDPTYYDSPIDFLIRPAQWKEENIINDLKRTQTKLIVVQTDFSMKGNINTNQSLPVLMNYIRSNYIRYKQFPLYDVYLLK